MKYIPLLLLFIMNQAFAITTRPATPTESPIPTSIFTLDLLINILIFLIICSIPIVIVACLVWKYRHPKTPLPIRAKKIITWSYGSIFTLFILSMTLLPYIVQTFGLYRARIQKECVMNGFWRWTCTFTNSTNANGYICGTVILKRIDDKNGEAQSPKICTGNMGPHSTTKQDFDIVGVSDMCDTANTWKKWWDVCSFAFKEDIQ